HYIIKISYEIFNIIDVKNYAGLNLYCSVFKDLNVNDVNFHYRLSTT
ncbi:hypothetical protein JOC73_002573, partial [Alkaliphilus hydrothermalis]|nr:hypothetical protein [Alkaliphilus hydrothermalis]